MSLRTRLRKITKAAIRRYYWYWLKRRVKKLPPMTPEEREEQRRSFAYGNVKLSNPEVTREMVDKVADEMVAARERRKARDEATLKAWKNVMKGAETSEISTPPLLDDEEDA